MVGTAPRHPRGNLLTTAGALSSELAALPAIIGMTLRHRCDHFVDLKCMQFLLQIGLRSDSIALDKTLMQCSIGQGLGSGYLRLFRPLALIQRAVAAIYFDDSSTCSSCAATDMAITSGALPVMPGTPMGQVMRASSAAVQPRSSSRCVKLARLVALPIRPM